MGTNVGARCRDVLQVHMQAASNKIFSRLCSRGERVEHLLWTCWHTALLYVWDRLEGKGTITIDIRR